MTDTYGPFDGSAPWAQDQWYRHAAKWAPSGVNGAPAASTSTGDLPLTLTGLNFTVGVGRAWVRGGGFERTGSPASQSVAANTNGSLSRRDRVVLRRDLSTKTIAPVLIQGTPAATPVAPAVQQVETGQWDLPLFSFLVPPNSGSAITGVIDERGWIRSSSDSVCFLTTAGRDAYFSAPNDGDTCIVAGYEHVYRSGSWRGFSSAAPTAYAGGIWVPGSPPLTAYRNKDGMVTLSGQLLTNVTWNEFRGNWAQLPSAYWPVGNTYALAYLDFGGVIAYDVGTDGTINGIAYVNGSYPIPPGHLLAFNHTYPGA